MPHDRGALIDQLRALLTEYRFSSVVVHNYCRGAEHFLEYLARRDVAVDPPVRGDYSATIRS
jgi:integrase/recombinase XerD